MKQSEHHKLRNRQIPHLIVVSIQALTDFRIEAQKPVGQRPPTAPAEEDADVAAEGKGEDGHEKVVLGAFHHGDWLSKLVPEPKNVIHDDDEREVAGVLRQPQQPLGLSAFDQLEAVHARSRGHHAEGHRPDSVAEGPHKRQEL